MRPTIPFGALLLGAAALDGQTAGGTITIPRVDRSPRIEEFTGSAPARGVRVTEFRQREPGDGVPASQRTAAYLSYDANNLYVVFVCADDPARVRANVARREEIDGDDHVVVYLDTYRDKKRAYMFAANPLGVQLDGIQTEGQDEDMSFDAVWTSEGRLTDSGYVVRIAIPFRSLRFGNGPQQTWGVALARVIRRENEEAYWPHITKRVQGLVPQFGTMNGLTRISPGRNVQLNPYSVAARARELDEDLAAYVEDGDERIGLDAKLVVRDGLTLDGTLNPDFSQVETDDPQVRVNQRFDVFFPEKRPFFLENAGYFQTPVNLFHSRQIVDPGVGVRLSGKMGRWAVGGFAMNDRQLHQLSAGEPLAGKDIWAGAVRVQRELGEESTVGLLVTGQEFTESFKYSRTYAADARWRAGDNWTLSGQVIRSDSTDRSGVRSSDWGARADLSFDSRNFDYSAQYEQFGPDFAAPLGFVSRVGYRRTEQDVEYTFRLKKGPLVQFGPSFAADFIWDHGTGALLDREIEGQFSVELRGETELQFGRTEAFELFDGFAFDIHANEAEFSTEWLKWLAVEAAYAWGTAVNHDPAEGLNPFVGDAREVEAGLILRPTPRLRFDQIYNYSTMRNRATAGRIFAERSLRSRLSYQFNPKLSIRAIVDYEMEDADTAFFDGDARDRDWRMDFLLTYLVHPGTAVYLGYTDEYENVSLLRGPPPEVILTRSPRTSVGRQVFVKVSYLWRF